MDLPLAHLRVCLLRGEGRPCPTPGPPAQAGSAQLCPGRPSIDQHTSWVGLATRLEGVGVCVCARGLGELLGGAAWPPGLDCDCCVPPSQQTSEPSYPDIILVAINRHGVLLIHPKTKVAAGPPEGLGATKSRDPCRWGCSHLCSVSCLSPVPSHTHSPRALEAPCPPTLSAPRTCSPPIPSPRSPAGAAAAPTSTWCWGAWAVAAACCARPPW